MNTKDRDDVDVMIHIAISEAKFEASERRVRHTITIFGWAIALLGISFPIFISYQSSAERKDELQQYIKIEEMKSKLRDDELNKAIRNFEDKSKLLNETHEKALEQYGIKFNQATSQMKHEITPLIENQKKQPRLTCLYNNTELDGRTIYTSGGSLEFSVVLFNSGNRVTDNIIYNIYVKDTIHTIGFQSHNIETPEDLYYSIKFIPNEKNIGVIKPDRTGIINFASTDVKSGKYPMMLEIFYGPPEALKVRFIVSHQTTF